MQHWQIYVAIDVVFLLAIAALFIRSGWITRSLGQLTAAAGCVASLVGLVVCSRIGLHTWPVIAEPVGLLFAIGLGARFVPSRQGLRLGLGLPRQFHAAALGVLVATSIALLAGTLAVIATLTLR